MACAATPQLMVHQESETRCAEKIGRRQICGFPLLRFLQSDLKRKNLFRQVLQRLPDQPQAFS